MALFYLETSALVKRYKKEAGSDVVDRIIDGRAAQDTLFISEFTSLEVEAAAARERKHSLDLMRYRAFLGRFARDLLTLSVQPLDEVTIEQAMRVTRDYALRAGDAIHLATALDGALGYKGVASMVSSDREIKDAAAAAGLVVIDPSEDLAVTQLKELRKSPL